jgi:hypothetical protein
MLARQGAVDHSAIGRVVGNRHGGSPSSFGKFPAGRRITVNRSAPAHLDYQITATVKRQEKIEDEGRRSENGVMRIASDGRRPALTQNEPEKGLDFVRRH